MKLDELLTLIKSEIKPAMGCTEPAAIGLAVSNTCMHLNKPANKIKLKLSSNIVKNAYCVTIPNTKESGIPLSAILGYLLTNKDNTIDIFAKIDSNIMKKAYELVTKQIVELECFATSKFYIEVWASNENEIAHTITQDKHDNLVFVKKDDKVIFDNRVDTKDFNTSNSKKEEEFCEYTIKELVDIAKTIDIEHITFLKKAVEVNKAASNEGLRGDYGMSVGKNIKNMIDNNIITSDLYYYVKMVTSAASDCRMGGGCFPAMTVVGSGNQGFQTTLPTIAACEFLNKDEETMIRGIFMSVLLTIRQKYVVGRLSPICGATLSGTSSAAVITWLLGGSYEQMEAAMRTMYATVTGMMCDGAKNGCAAKLSACSGEAVIAARLAINDVSASKVDGIVCDKIEDSINGIARLSKEGMAAVDMNVIEILMSKKI